MTLQILRNRLVKICKGTQIRILIASVAAVLVSVAALVGIYFGVSVPDTSRKVYAVEDTLANDAEDVFTRGGAPAVRTYFERIEAAQPGVKRSLVDSNGRDVVTGEDRSDLLRLSDGTHRPPRDAR